MAPVMLPKRGVGHHAHHGQCCHKMPQIEPEADKINRFWGRSVSSLRAWKSAICVHECFHIEQDGLSNVTKNWFRLPPPIHVCFPVFSFPRLNFPISCCPTLFLVGGSTYFFVRIKIHKLSVCRVKFKYISIYFLVIY